MQEQRWKVYLEIDDDGEDDNGDIVSDTGDVCVRSCVKHVMFVCKFPPYDIFRLAKVCGCFAGQTAAGMC